MGDFENGVKIFETYLDILKGGFYVGDVYIEWHEKFYQDCIHQIKPYLTSKETAHFSILHSFPGCPSKISKLLSSFWSLRCGPCIREMPDIAAYAGELPDNVRIITVCLDGEGKEEQEPGNSPLFSSYFPIAISSSPKSSRHLLMASV